MVVILAIVLALSGAFATAPRPARANGRFPAAGQLVVDRTDGGHIVVRTTFGLLQSFDAGATWSWICEQATGPYGFQDPEVIVTTGGRIGLGLPDGLAVGDRTGCQWTRVPGLANANVIDLVTNPAAPATAYAAAAVTVNGAYNTLIAGTSDGVSWSATGALLPDTYPLTIELAPSRPARMYLGANDGNLETGRIDVSDDGGATWTRHDSPAGVDSVYISAVDPAAPERVYVRAVFPTNSLYVSEDGAATWSLIHDSASALTGFALAPDGRRLAVGGADGVTIVSRSDSPTGSVYAVTATNPLPVNCLTWTTEGLFACADEATAGFTIGRSADEGATFAPLLHFADLTVASCPLGSSAAACAAAWCATATVIGASCAATGSTDAGSGDAAVVDAGMLPGGVISTAGGCTCGAVSNRFDGGPAAGIAVAVTLMAIARRKPIRRRRRDSNARPTSCGPSAAAPAERG